jgi:hypothetical protein
MKVLERKMKVSNWPADMDKEERDAIKARKLEQKRLAQLARDSHTGEAVTGLAVDSVNKALISIGLDAKLILWNFPTHAHSPQKKVHTHCCHRPPSCVTCVILSWPQLPWKISLFFV